MADTATIQARIDEIDAILAGGVKSTQHRDRRVDFDLEALEKERSRLQRILTGASGGGFRRVVFKNG